MKAITAYTAEIDDASAAVSEILAQLDMAQNLRAHSVGLISCYSEFIESGVVKAICEALPFDVIGCTTAGSAVSGMLGELILCLIALTGDELVFSAGASEPLIPEPEAALAEAYRQVREKLPGEPSLMIAFTPFVKNVPGERVIEIFSGICPELPIFGAQAIDYIDIKQFTKTYTFFNGESRRDAVAFLLIYGDIHPAFFTASLSEVCIQKQKAVVTKSEGNRVIEVNGMPLLLYLEKIGMSGVDMGTSLSFPFMVDYRDGTKPVPRASYTATPEGHMVFGGRIPVGAMLAVGDMDYQDVLATAKELLGTVIAQKGSCILLFSCLMRYLILGADTVAEMELTRAAIGKRKPYYFLYSGGEFCPVRNERGRLVNRFHNCTVIACVL
ncbi:MAG: FIST C-terminal domain-containing protein [Spirochaetaceae bacterium]|jgi:hypothetical protein|nr:FIST C-terminal domain-containing protein [Spirochaetaceae bacterium]